MLNVLDFCNSDTVRDYWKEINYKPNCYEAAWVIWDSFTKSVNDKLEAFDYILNNFEDKPFYSYGDKKESFFEALRKFKKAIQILKTQITEETNSIFTIEEHYKACNGEYTSKSIDKIFNDYNKLINYTREDCCESTLYYEVKCNYIDCDSCLYFTLNSKLELVFIRDYDNKELDLFDSIYIKFPLPFKKGDIVQSKNYFSDCNKFVLELVETSERKSDSSDMIAAGYWLSDKDFYWDHTLGYNLDLEVVNPIELSREEIGLNIIREYLLNNIGLEQFYNLLFNFFAEINKKEVDLYSEDLNRILNGYKL